MVRPLASTFCTASRQVCGLVGAILDIFHDDVTKLQAMPAFMAAHCDLLPGNWTVSCGKGASHARIRPEGGHTRMIGSRQSTMPAAVPASTRMLATQATASPIRRRAGTAGDAARRCIASASAAAGPGSSSGANGGGISGGGSGAGTTSGFQVWLQRAQRTDRPGVRREAGTSYSAPQPGQAICMEIHYDVIRIIA